ncbi:unnamed protein product, partial [Dibothriocephalus latus]
MLSVYEANPHMVSEEVFTFPEAAEDALENSSVSPPKPTFAAYDRQRALSG